MGRRNDNRDNEMKVEIGGLLAIEKDNMRAPSPNYHGNTLA